MATTKDELAKQIAEFVDRVAADVHSMGRRQVAQRAFDTATVGMRGARVQLEDIARRASGSASEGVVASYAEQMVSALKSLESVSGIKPSEFQEAAQTIITDVMSFVRSNPLLTDGEKQEIDQFASELQQYATKRGAFSTRAKGAVSGLATKVRGSVADAFLASNDILSRSIGKLLQGGSARDDRRREIGGIREAATYDASTLAEDVMGDTGRRESLISRFTTPRDAKGRFQKLETGESKFLDYQAAILNELQLIRKGDEERDEQSQVAAEVGQDIYKGVVPAGGSAAAAASTQKKETGGWFGTIKKFMGMDGLGGLFGSVKNVSGIFGSMRGVVSGILPSLSTLGTGALVAGAALAGWEIGKWIDEKTGASKKLSEGIAWSMGKLGLGGFEDQDKRMKEQEERNKKAAAAARTAMSSRPSTSAATIAPSSTTSVVAGETFADGAFAEAAPLETLGEGRALPSIPTVTSTSAPTSATPSPTRVSQAEGMTTSDAMIRELGVLEGFSPTAYQDKGKVWTIGYGSTTWQGRRVTESWPGRPVTEDEAYQEKVMMVREKEKGVRKALKKPVTQDQFDALVSVAYNKGNANDLIAKINKGDELKYEDFARTATVKGQRGKDIGQYGLELRRAKEYARFTGQQQLIKAIDGGGGNGQARYARFTTALASSRAAAPVSTGTTQLAEAQTAAPAIMMVNASRGNAAPAPPPMTVPMPVRPRDPSMEPLSRV